MTPKEKAEALVAVMYDVDFWDDPNFPTMEYEHAKQCALRAVDEIINYCSDEHIDYLEQVKQEIQSL